MSKPDDVKVTTSGGLSVIGEITLSSGGKICTEAARRDSDKGGSPLPEHMLKENGERPTGRDSIMANVVKAIAKAAADAGRIEVTATISRTPAPDEVG